MPRKSSLKKFIVFYITVYKQLFHKVSQIIFLWTTRANIQKDVESNHERVKAVMAAMEAMERDWEARAEQILELQVTCKHFSLRFRRSK